MKEKKIAHILTTVNLFLLLAIFITFGYHLIKTNPSDIALSETCTPGIQTTLETPFGTATGTYTGKETHTLDNEEEYTLCCYTAQATDGTTLKRCEQTNSETETIEQSITWTINNGEEQPYEQTYPKGEQTCTSGYDSNGKKTGSICNQ